jgi:hypothetical protein
VTAEPLGRHQEIHISPVDFFFPLPLQLQLTVFLLTATATVKTKTVNCSCACNGSCKNPKSQSCRCRGLSTVPPAQESDALSNVPLGHFDVTTTTDFGPN